MVVSHSSHIAMNLPSRLAYCLHKCTFAPLSNVALHDQEILEVEQLMGDEDVGLELTAENVEKSLDEIRYALTWPGCQDHCCCILTCLEGH